jgi:hypothetical protein
VLLLGIEIALSCPAINNLRPHLRHLLSSSSSRRERQAAAATATFSITRTMTKYTRNSTRIASANTRPRCSASRITMATRIATWHVQPKFKPTRIVAKKNVFVASRPMPKRVQERFGDNSKKLLHCGCSCFGSFPVMSLSLFRTIISILFSISIVMVTMHTPTLALAGAVNTV